VIHTFVNLPVPYLLLELPFWNRDQGRSLDVPTATVLRANEVIECEPTHLYRGDGRRDSLAGGSAGAGFIQATTHCFSANGPSHRNQSHPVSRFAAVPAAAKAHRGIRSASASEGAYR
jgi:hypothetical protein